MHAFYNILTSDRIFLYVVLLLVLVFLMPYAALIPMPTIAAILLQVAYNMSGWRSFAHLCATASRGATGMPPKSAEPMLPMP